MALVTATASRSERTMEELEMTAKRCRRNRRSVWPAQGLLWRSRCWWFRLENSSDTPIFEDFSFLGVSSTSQKQQFALTDSLLWKLYQMHQPVIVIFIQWYFCKTVVVFICSFVMRDRRLCHYVNASHSVLSFFSVQSFQLPSLWNLCLPTYFHLTELMSFFSL